MKLIDYAKRADTGICEHCVIHNTFCFGTTVVQCNLLNFNNPLPYPLPDSIHDIEPCTKEDWKNCPLNPDVKSFPPSD